MLITIGTLIFSFFYRIFDKIFVKHSKGKYSNDILDLFLIFISLIILLYLSISFSYLAGAIVFLPIIIGTSAHYLIRKFFLENNKKYSHWDKFKNPPMWIFIFIIMSLLYLDFMYFRFYFFEKILIFLSIIYATLVFITVDMFKWDKKDLRIKGHTPLEILYLFLFIIFLLIIPVNYLGQMDAESLIKGESDYFEIQFYIKDKNISVPNNVLILVSQNNGYYYLTEKNNITPPKNNKNPPSSKLYVIPENGIENVSIRYYNESNNRALAVTTKGLNYFLWIPMKNENDRWRNLSNNLYKYYDTYGPKKPSSGKTKESTINQGINQSIGEIDKVESPNQKKTQGATKGQKEEIKPTKNVSYIYKRTNGKACV
jgi:hypothetical protein